MSDDEDVMGGSGANEVDQRQYVITLSNVSDAPSSQIHLLPCRISKTGPAQVSDFFRVREEPKVKEEDPQVYQAFLRGKDVKGNKVMLPPSFTGYQLRVVDNEDENDEETKSFKLQSKFDSYINWSHDFVSSRPDNFMKALEYLNVATELHKIEIEE